MVPKKITRLIPEISRYSEYSAARHLLSAKNFAGRSWHHGRTILEVTEYPRELSILVISGTWTHSVDEAHLPVRASVTRRPADGYATPIMVVVVTAKKMVITKQSTRALTVSSGMSRRTRGAASMPQVVRSFPSSDERVQQLPPNHNPRSLELM